MMRSTAVAIPIDLLRNYKKLHISDVQFLNILALLYTGGDWNEAAEIRGYASGTTLRTAMKSILDQGIMTENSLDGLFARLRQPVSVGLFVSPVKERTSSDNELSEWDKIKGKVYGSKHMWTSFFKEMYKDGHTLTRIIEVIEWVFNERNKNNSGPKRLVSTSEVRGNIAEEAEIDLSKVLDAIHS